MKSFHYLAYIVLFCAFTLKVGIYILKQIPEEVDPLSDFELKFKKKNPKFKRWSCVEFEPDEYKSCPPLTNIIIVHSKPSNYFARETIRKTWGREAFVLGIWVRFIIGQPNDPDGISKLLKYEMSVYEDIILSHCMESYENITLKTVSYLSWVEKFCPNGGFIFKTNDYVFVNVNYLVEVLQHQLKPRMIIGHLSNPLMNDINLHRKQKNPNKIFESPLYVPFLTGQGYGFLAEIAGPLYSASLDTPYTDVEDMFLTGLVAEKAEMNLELGLATICSFNWEDKMKMLLILLPRVATVSSLDPETMELLYHQAAETKLHP